MKVLIINRDVGTGSVGKICEDLYFDVKKDGHICKIAYGHINKSRVPDEDLFKFGSSLSIARNAFCSRVFDNDGFGAKSETKALIRFISDFSPDVIHIHGCYGYYINLPLLLRFIKLHNIPLISTLHSCWDFTGHCCYFTKSGCNKWKTGCNKCPEKKSYPSSVICDNSKMNYIRKKRAFEGLEKFTVVAPSQWMADLVKESFLSFANIMVINNGIDLSVFKPTTVDLRKYGIRKDKKIILGVASVWDSRKGLDDFIELAKIIDDNYQIVIVGIDKPQSVLLPSNIVTIRRTEVKEELVALYSAASVFFNPTYEDNYPTVNLEAIACGTPVVTYETGGSPEAVKRFSFGSIVDKKDYAALLRAIDEFDSANPLDAADLEELSNRTMTRRYINLYKKVSSN